MVSRRLLLLVEEWTNDRCAKSLSMDVDDDWLLNVSQGQSTVNVAAGTFHFDKNTEPCHHQQNDALLVEFKHYWFF